MTLQTRPGFTLVGCVVLAVLTGTFSAGKSFADELKSPCDLVAMEDVRALDPSVAKTNLDDTYADMGLLMCSWLDEGDDPKLVIALREAGGGGDVRDTLAAGGLLDDDAIYVELDGPGDSAGAVFSAPDEKFGHPAQLLQLMVKRGRLELSASPFVAIEDPESEAFFALRALLTAALGRL